MKALYVYAIACLLLVSACDKLGLSKEEKPQAQPFTEQGYALLAKDQPAAALPLFDKVISADSNALKAYQGKGVALDQLGKHEEAEAAYAKALKIDPKATGVINNLAMSKILRGKYQEAIDLLAPLATATPPNETVQQNYALAHCLIGKRDEARQLYAKYLAPAQVEENLRFCSKFETMRKKK